MTRESRPLVLTADTELLDDLLGMAAAVGVAVDVSVEPAVCRPQWTQAPLVLVGADLLETLSMARLERRPGVLLLTRGSPSDALRDTATMIGAEETIGLPSGEAGLLDRLADLAEPAARARVVGVVGGRGGAGASVLAAGLALTAALRGPSWLVDLDPLGGGADAGLGAELAPGARWADLGVLSGRLSPTALYEAVPTVHGLAVLAATDAAELTPDAVRAVVAAASRGGGTIVLDLPRHRTAGRDEALTAADELLVVIPAEVRSVLAARRVVDGLGSTPAPRAVVRTGPGALPSREVVRGADLPFAGELADEAAVRQAVQVGNGAGLIRGTRLGELCEHLLGRTGAVREAA
ncbi:MAG TPA: septum site-determining protein Ssd [Mycobacteriales bacterium]|jgi:secretion/DNA translocation related CpaE-like protein|nr:septum site-determining protein Ssd [Mycobacteriales bacterium]